MAGERVFGDGTNSSIGSEQFNDFYWQKKSLIELKTEQYFGQLADTTSMPKNMGKKIKQYHYLPLLDDANINDQGIDANGAITEFKETFMFLPPSASVAGSGRNLVYVKGTGTGAAAATTAAKLEDNFVGAFAEAGFTVVWNTDYPTTVTDIINLGWGVVDDANNTIPGRTYKAPVFEGGNLYGSSKDIGTINSKLPALSEVGGRVNRVGFKRVSIEGSLEKFGFFDEFTQESMDFDTDGELVMHINREMLRGANELEEANLQIDLLNAAGVVRFGGIATTTAEVTAEGTVSIPSFEDFIRMSIDLDDNRTPKHTTMITGTRLIDTKTMQSARYMYIGSELVPMVKKFKSIDPSSPVGSGFNSVEKYASNGNTARGEIGQIDQIKIIVVPEMLHWAGAGAAVTANPGFRETNGRYDVYPMLIVGDKSFTTIGFQTDGKTTKFKIKTVKPGDNVSYGQADPFGEIGFMSIKWYYGFMALRPERIALFKVVAEY